MFSKNCVVRCVGYNAFESLFTIGKTYVVENNNIRNDNGYLYRGGSKSIVDWLSYWYKFELVEHTATTCDICGEIIENGEYHVLDGDILCDDCFEEKTVFCDCCGRVMLEDNAEYINDEVICPECKERYYFYCDCCGELVHRNYRNYAQGEHVCDSCVEEYYVFCGDCGELIHRDYAVWDESAEDYFCESCCEDRKERVIHDYHYKPIPIFYGNGDFKMGVELEIDEAGEDGENAQILLDIANETNEHIYIKHDGSLDMGFEIVSHPATLEYHTNDIAWRELMEKAVSMGYRSHNTNTCGLHVHVSRKALGNTYEERDETISKILYFIEKNWNEIVRFTRRNESNLNRWASRYGIEATPKETYEKAKNDWNRYRCINLLNDNTIEFRMFRGTLKHSTFIATLQLVYLICDTCKMFNAEEIENLTWNNFINSINAEKYTELMEYLDIRGLNV